MKQMSKRLENLKVISNASPLIYLSRIGRLRLLCDLFGVISIPDAVADEILRGKDLSDGFASAMEVEDAIDTGWITVEEQDMGEHDMAEIYSHDPRIHPGEAAVLAMGRRSTCCCWMISAHARLQKHLDLIWRARSEYFYRRMISG